MVKFFLNSRSPQKQQPKDVTPRAETVTRYFYIYIEYRVLAGPKAGGQQETLPFAAIHRADWSGNGFLEIIHPALAMHQVRCSRNQIEFGVVFELNDNVDIDAPYTPDTKKIVWQLNLEKYDTAALASRIKECPPRKVRIGTGG
jgi:hypothetical protein